MNVQPRKTTVRSRRIHSISARSLSDSEPQPVAGAIAVGVISDSASVQNALSVVINAVAAGTLDPARAKVLLYGLQIAAANAKRVTAGTETVEAASNGSEQIADDAPATIIETATASIVEEPQAVRDEERDSVELEEIATATNSEDEPAQAEAETPAQPINSPGQGSIPSICFSSDHEYKNESSLRERMLKMQARSVAQSAITPTYVSS
jgi:hypothetical protein